MTGPEALLVFQVCRNLWSIALTSRDRSVAERMMHPQPGELVAEVTKLRRDDPDAVGRLIRIEGGPDGRYVIEPLHRPGEEQGWQNALFVAVPDSPLWNWVSGQSGEVPGTSAESGRDPG